MGKVGSDHSGTDVFSFAGAPVMGHLHRFNSPIQWQVSYFAFGNEPARLVSGIYGPAAIIRSGPRQHDVGRRLCIAPVDWKS